MSKCEACGTELRPVENHPQYGPTNLLEALDADAEIDIVHTPERCLRVQLDAKIVALTTSLLSEHTLVERLVAAEKRATEAELERDVAKTHVRELRPIADDYLKESARAERFEKCARYYLNHGSTIELQNMCRAALAADAPETSDPIYEECRACSGYGFIGEDGRATIDRRARKCLDCGGVGHTGRTPETKVGP